MKGLVKFYLESGGFVFVETEIMDVERGSLNSGLCSNHFSY